MILSSFLALKALSVLGAKVAGTHAAYHVSLQTAAQVGSVIGGTKAAYDLYQFGERERQKREIRAHILLLQNQYHQL